MCEKCGKYHLLIILDTKTKILIELIGHGNNF